MQNTENKLALDNIESNSNKLSFTHGLSIHTIGRLIGGSKQSPIIEPRIMAQKLKVTFRPLPRTYKNEEVIKFREELKVKLQDYGVNVKPWEEAMSEFQYETTTPFFGWKINSKRRVIKSSIDAVIDVEQIPSFIGKIKSFAAEKFYQIYSFFTSEERGTSQSMITNLTSWAEESAIKYIRYPSRTQLIMLRELDNEFVDPALPYEKRIKIGLNTLFRTLSQIAIGVSSTRFCILNLNLSDSVFSKDELDKFVINSLIPKTFLPIMPIPIGYFELDKYEPSQSIYAEKLINLSNQLAQISLFPAGSKFSKLVKQKSRREIIDIMVDGRKAVSYGFIAYIEAPQYIGDIEITESQWESLQPVNGFSFDQVRQNSLDRRYIKIETKEKDVFKQIPDIWLISSRSGSNKTNLNLENDLVRIGLKEKLFLQLPKGIDDVVDIKPSYDIYVMLAIALSTALFAPKLIKDGAPIIHFHGYPNFEWFKANEYYTGVQNPSVPCGTYESGVFNFLGMSSLVKQYGESIALASLIEPEHGTNVIAQDLEYLVKRVKEGCERGQIELGGKNFSSLKEFEISTASQDKS